MPQLGAVQLQSLNAAQINAHYARLLNEGRVHGSGGLSPNTVHHVHAVLHRALRDAVKWGYLQTNAAACADPPRASAQHKELPVWSEEQLHAFFDSVAQQRLYPLWRFLAMTGCRRGEALGLTWRDLDIEEGRVAIVRALVPINGRLCETEPKTKRGRRLIALDAETVAVLESRPPDSWPSSRHWAMAGSTAGGCSPRRTALSCTPSASAPCSVASCARRRCPRSPCRGCGTPTPAWPWPRVSIRRSSRDVWDTATVAFTLDIYSHVLPQVDAEAAELIAEFAGRES